MITRVKDGFVAIELLEIDCITAQWLLDLATKLPWTKKHNKSAKISGCILTYVKKQKFLKSVVEKV